MGSQDIRRNLVIRKYTPQDYENYKKLWLNQDNCPPPESLPKNGLVIGDFEAVGFVSDTDTNFGLIVWYMFNHKLPLKRKRSVIYGLFEALGLFAQSLEKRYLFCYTNRKSIINLLRKLNYVEIEQGHMGKDYG